MQPVHADDRHVGAFACLKTSYLGTEPHRFRAVNRGHS
jgi:hypothetical protein